MKSAIRLSYQQLGAIALILINIILAGPGGFLLKHLWNETQTFRTETTEQLDDLQNKINQLSVDVSDKCVTRKDFSGYKEQMGETIRHLDNKIRP